MAQTTSPNVYAATGGAAVTPSDTTVIGPFRALYVGATGNVALRMAGDNSVLTFVGLPAGTVLPVQFDRVMATNTTAGSLVALY
jgi:hypothetical protein